MAKDFIRDTNDDLLIKNGAFAVGESTMQEVSLLLRLNQRAGKQVGFRTAIGIAFKTRRQRL
jgi:hypothetical protein